MRTCLAVIAATVLTAPAAADDPTVSSLTDTIRAAVAARKVEDSDNLSRTTFRDVASDGSVLVGVEVALVPWFNREIPFAVRPVYRRGLHEWVGGTAGTFAAREVIRTQRETAKVGYAVGGIWVRTGAGMDRLCLNFFKLTDAGLDPSDSYASPWVGTSDGGSDHYLDGRGRPIVGLAADAGPDQARGLGLVFAQVPPVPRKKEPKAAKVDPKKEPPAAVTEAAGAKKSKLEQAAPPKQEDNTGVLLLVVLGCMAVGIPVGIIAILSVGSKDRRPGEGETDDRPRRRRPDGPDRDRPRPSDQEASPEPKPATTDRPELARRLGGHAPRLAASAAPGLSLTNGEAPPYFLVRATYRARHERMTRVYVTTTELLVIDCGSGADINQAAGFTSAALAGGGLIGGLIGGAVGGMVADAAKAKGEAIQQRLNRLGLDELLALAEEKGNVRAPLSELVGVSVDPPSKSFWRERTKAVGMFRFRHLGQGEYTFEFLNGAEVRGAVELLRRVLGSGLHVGEGWDEATAVYLTGL